MTGAFSGHLPGTSGYRRLLVGLFFAGVATFAQLYSPQAVLPLIAADLDVHPATAALSVSAATAGLAASVVPWSAVADRIGRVPAMAIGIIAASSLAALAPVWQGIVPLLAVRLLEGAALGAVPAVAMAYLSEEVHRRHAAAAAGGYIAGTTVGGLAGRLVAGPVGGLFGWQAAIWATAALCVMASVLFLTLVPRAAGFIPGRSRAHSGPGIGRRLLAALRSPTLWMIYSEGFILMGAFVAVYNYMGFHLSAPPFALPTALVSLLFLAYLAGTLASPWAGRLAAAHGRLRVLRGAILITALGVVVMLIPVTWAILAGLVVFTGGFFGAHAVASGWSAAAAPPESRAQASSLYYFAYYGGSSLFGWALGLLFGRFGWEWFILAVLGMCALAAALTAALRRPSGPATVPA